MRFSLYSFDFKWSPFYQFVAICDLELVESKRSWPNTPIWEPSMFPKMSSRTYKMPAKPSLPCVMRCLSPCACTLLGPGTMPNAPKWQSTWWGQRPGHAPAQRRKRAYRRFMSCAALFQMIWYQLWMKPTRSAKALKPVHEKTTRTPAWIQTNQPSKTIQRHWSIPGYRPAKTWTVWDQETPTCTTPKQRAKSWTLGILLPTTRVYSLWVRQRLNRLLVKRAQHQIPVLFVPKSKLRSFPQIYQAWCIRRWVWNLA